MTILLNKITNIGNINPNNIFELLCDLYIKNKNIKIVKYKKMTLITYRLQEIDINLYKPHNLSLLLKKTYVSLFFNEFICKS